MPLERLEDAPGIKLEGITFEMRDEDDGRTVQCVLTPEALIDVFDAPLQRSGCEPSRNTVTKSKLRRATYTTPARRVSLCS
jgi:hypothetical protein